MPFHILLDSSFLLRLPISVVAHLETFSGVLFWQKSKPWLCIHISLPHQSSLMYATWCRQRHNLALRISSKQQHEESLSPSSSPFFLHLFIFFFFFLSHSCSAGAFSPQPCSQIFSNVSCGAKKGFSEFDWSGCHKPGWEPFIGHSSDCYHRMQMLSFQCALGPWA